jgi:hypothetical protein
LIGHRFEVILLLSRIRMSSVLMVIFKMKKEIVWNVHQVVSDVHSQTNVLIVLKILNLWVVLSFLIVLWNVSKDNIVWQSILLPMIYLKNLINRIQKLTLNLRFPPNICFKLVKNVQLVVVIVTRHWTNKMFFATIVALDITFNSMDSVSQIHKT